MRKSRILRSLLSFLLIATALSAITPSASAATIGSGNCVQNVGSTTGITVTTYADRCVVKFTSTTATTWQVPRGVTSVWVLVVGGGGGGGSDEGGGGGAGGFIESTDFAVTSQSSISVDIGAGGAGSQDANTDRGANGGNSIFSTLTAVGGGGGGTAVNASSFLKNGSNGGSGGGGAGEDDYTLGAGGTRTTGQGFNGGSGYATRGGGGGGASETGNADGTAQGGDGKISTIADGSTSITYAGGGGGGGGNSVTSGGVTGGSGGGGTGGGGSTCPTAGTDGLGGGGGGGAGSCTASTYFGADGGNGVVIVNYQYDITPPQITSATNLSVAENTSASSLLSTIRANESTTITMASGSDSADFTLTYSDSLSVLLKFAVSPNFESPNDSDLNNSYSFTLNIEDYSGNTATQAFTVTVGDLNESPSIGAFSSAASNALTIAENTATLYNLNASDEDTNTSLSYSLTGVDASDFTVNGSGDLNFASIPDFENPLDSNSDNIYIVIAWVSDGVLTDSQTVTITITDLNESGVVTTPALSATPYKGVSVTITVNLNAAGKVRFLVGGKKIPNCLAVRTVGSGSNYTATCNWKPAVMGRQSITARLTPTLNTFSSVTSPAQSVWVTKRTTTR